MKTGSTQPGELFLFYSTSTFIHTLTFYNTWADSLNGCYAGDKSLTPLNRKWLIYHPRPRKMVPNIHRRSRYYVTCFKNIITAVRLISLRFEADNKEESISVNFSTLRSWTERLPTEVCIPYHWRRMHYRSLYFLAETTAGNEHSWCEK